MGIGFGVSCKDAVQAREGVGLKFVIKDTYDEMSRAAADIVAGCISGNPECVLGLATGSSPVGMYQCLVDDCNAGKISFADVTSFNLDEYCNLSPENDQSYRYFMDTNLFSHVDIDPSAANLPSGIDADEKTCAAYDSSIDSAGGIDLQVLGIGHNGHIGFNEPDSSFPVGTHIVDLKESTIEANSRFFDSIDDVPKSAITMGIGTIMKARKIVVVANGEGKAEIVKKAFEGPVVPDVPASVLQLHPDVTVVLDREAASMLD